MKPAERPTSAAVMSRNNGTPMVERTNLSVVGRRVRGNSVVAGCTCAPSPHQLRVSIPALASAPSTCAAAESAKLRLQVEETQLSPNPLWNRTRFDSGNALRYVPATAAHPARAYGHSSSAARPTAA